jgi:hypothetical protein
MMSFEEFFLKKKIDLIALAATKPDLFSEFKEHYALMGEKSFDHTKKYWFNQLRLSHKLSEDDEVQLKATLYPAKEVIPNQVLKTEVAVDAPVTKAPGFKPRFKAPNTVTQPIAKTVLEDPAEITGKPVTVTGFKPRFKATSTPVKQEEPELTIPVEKIKEEPVKPLGFKPRFKAGSTPSKQED